MNWGKEAKAGDAASRSIMKAFAWRAFAMVNTMIISLFFAKNMKIGASCSQAAVGGLVGCDVARDTMSAREDW